MAGFYGSDFCLEVVDGKDGKTVGDRVYSLEKAGFEAVSLPIGDRALVVVTNGKNKDTHRVPGLVTISEAEDKAKIAEAEAALKESQKIEVPEEAEA